MNKKSLKRKQIFVQTPFSISILHLEQQKFTTENLSLFCFPSSIELMKIIALIWLKIHKNLWTDFLKKDKSWNKIQIFFLDNQKN